MYCVLRGKRGIEGDGPAYTSLNSIGEKYENNYDKIRLSIHRDVYGVGMGKLAGLAKSGRVSARRQLLS